MTKRILVIGNKNYSSWSIRPWLALKHAGIEFEEQLIQLYQPDSKERILEVSPAGLVPALIEDDLTLWDSLAICEYAADLNPELWPRGRKLRAWARAVAAEMHSGFANIREQLPVNCRATGRVVELHETTKLEIKRVQALWNSCREAHAPEGPWLFGRFSIADAMWAPVATRFNTYGIPMDPVSEAYVQTVFNDTHMKEWLAAAEAEPMIVTPSEVGQV